MIEIKTKRLIIREFVPEDLENISRILDQEIDKNNQPEALQARKDWLQWTILGYEQQQKLCQPPYGERAVVKQETNELIGACGFVPCLDVFSHIPYFATPEGQTSTELGLYYALSPTFRKQGYITEAVIDLCDYAFDKLKLHRIVATTTYDNKNSIRVMERIGMTIMKNSKATPPWLQVVGVLERQNFQSL